MPDITSDAQYLVYLTLFVLGTIIYLVLSGVRDFVVGTKLLDYNFAIAKKHQAEILSEFGLGEDGELADPFDTIPREDRTIKI